MIKKVIAEISNIQGGDVGDLHINGALVLSGWAFPFNIESLPNIDHSSINIKKVLKLKEAGFTCEDIVELKKENLI